MSWIIKVVTVLAENKNREGELKSKWEITRPENDETGKHFAEGLQKTSYYMKDGELKRGYPQPLTIYDLKWIKNNWIKILEAIDPTPGQPASPPEPASPTEAEIEEVPF